MKPFWKFFHCKFHDYRNTAVYKGGVRTILSIQYEQPINLISDDSMWNCYVRHFKIVVGILLIDIWIPCSMLYASDYSKISQDCQEFDI